MAKKPETTDTPVSPTSIARPRLASYVDGLLGEDSIVGWAFDRDAPEVPVKILIKERNRSIAAGIADQHRPDVREAGIGDGYSGFCLALPERVFDGQDHLFEVYGEGSAETSFLLGTVSATLPYRGDARPSQSALVVPPTPLPEELDERQAALRDFGTASLEAALAAALTRAEELDHANRLLASERDEYSSRLRALSERFGRDLTAISAAPHHANAAYPEGILDALSVTERRDLWLDQLSRLKVEGPVFATFPHNGASGKLSLLVWGSGGIGDILYLSTVVRELFLLFRECNIFVLHENQRVHDVLSTNPYVSGTIWLEADALYDFIRTAHAFDIFDLIAEVKYAITYTRPPLSRISQDFFRIANVRSAEWQRYVRYRWPHLNNFFANAVVAQGLCKLDLVGVTSLLPIDRYSPLDIFFDHSSRFPSADSLRNVRYATLHHGSDRKMSAAGGVQTKNLPETTWRQVVSQLKAFGYATVQLGEPHEQRIEGIDVDLRGKTSLRETALVLKMARVHLDTEGGLVHLARAVHTRSVVAFGPTPVDFFGYPQNENLPPPVCGNCWWVIDKWATQCPRRLSAPECMSTHTPATIIEKAVKIAQEYRSFEMTRAVMPWREGDDRIGQLMETILAGQGNGALFAASEQAIDVIAGAPKDIVNRTACYVPFSSFQDFQDRVEDSMFVLPYSTGNIPRNGSTLDWAVILDPDPADGAFIPLCLEVARCVRPGGQTLVLIGPNRASDLMKLLKSGPRSWLERQIGDRASLRWSSEGVPLLDKSETGQPILLKIAALGHQELAADPSTDVRVEAAFYSTNQIEQIEQIGQPEAR